MPSHRCSKELRNTSMTLALLGLLVGCSPSPPPAKELAAAPAASTHAPDRAAPPSKPNTDPRIGRERILSELRQSGNSQSEQSKKILNTFQKLREVAPKRGIEVASESECFQKGCAVPIKVAALPPAMEQLQGLMVDAKQRWDGPVAITGAEPNPESRNSSSFLVLYY